MEPRKFRIAPTPSGFLHRGNATNFLLTACRAACAGAVLRLRIDDLDQERVRREYVEDIFESLCWLGIHWQEGPANVDDQEKSYSQRYRIPRYEALLQQLKESGKVFACNCSRTDLAVRGTMDYDGFLLAEGTFFRGTGCMLANRNAGRCDCCFLQPVKRRANGKRSRSHSLLYYSAA